MKVIVWGKVNKLMEKLFSLAIHKLTRKKVTVMYWVIKRDLYKLSRGYSLIV